MELLFSQARAVSFCYSDMIASGSIVEREVTFLELTMFQVSTKKLKPEL